MQARIGFFKNLAFWTAITASLFLNNGCALVAPGSKPSHPTTISSPDSPTLPPTTIASPDSSSPSPEDSSGTVKLRYSVSGIIYESTLAMNGDSGKMLTTYFDPNTNSTETVEQSMKFEPSAQGLVLLGYDPVYAGTQTSHPTYSPDNFLFRVNPDGSKQFFTCDDAERCSPVEIIEDK